MSRIKDHASVTESVTIDHLAEPTPLERSTKVWHAYHALDNTWEGEQFFLGEVDNDLYRAMEMVSANYVHIAFGWDAGTDPEDEAPGADLKWELLTRSRWRLMNFGRHTGVVLHRQDVWGTRAS
jgi:hypothetical protein